MKLSAESTNIIKALIKVQSSLETIKKDRVNRFADNYKYATLDAILESILPKLSENNIFMTQEPISIEDGEGDKKRVKIGVITRLYHSSGESIEYEPFFMPLEKGSKMNMAQSTGSVITFAKRYSISAIFGISTGDDSDGVQQVESDTHPHSSTDNQIPKIVYINGRQLADLKKLSHEVAEISNAKPDSVLSELVRVMNIQSPDKIETKDFSNAKKQLYDWKTFYANQRKAEEQSTNQNITWGQ